MRFKHPHPDTPIIGRLLDVAQKMEFRRASDRATKRAVDNAFANSGVEEGETPNDEQARRLAKDIAEGLMPFITHNMMRLRESVGSGRFRRSLDRGRGPAVIGE